MHRPRHRCKLSVQVHFLYDRSMLDAICRGRHSIRELAQEYRVNMRVDNGAGVACANSFEDVLMVRVYRACKTIP